MKDMRSIAVNLDSLDFLGIDISSDLRTLVNDEHSFSSSVQPLGNSRAEQSGAYDQKIILHKLFLSRKLYLLGLICTGIPMH